MVVAFLGFVWSSVPHRGGGNGPDSETEANTRRQTDGKFHTARERIYVPQLEIILGEYSA